MNVRALCMPTASLVPLHQQFNVSMGFSGISKKSNVLGETVRYNNA